ncbi:peptidoglycan DD-metalloendopeptidase family protein [Nitratifractor salsuginis]|uniref:Peptidase M23 n=1 Tax=Nitratifractor salsuginis (strain DSM 16511 / JCM 12458 / E9I37-1) TaxID=749222 RepID=E6WZ27_NITSE|nr:peptidoglycan DD-metalloendopeptidase family protein [Nitratifractor salsuginis]ADV45477.1 Peptidase M23 [Nitratifractor salsuginis DSM 16511]
MRFVWLMLVGFLLAWGAEVREAVWQKGETFSEYLQRNGISQDLLSTIGAEDSKYLSEIQAGEPFYELREGETLLQALIPIGEEMQIQLSRDLKNGRYRFDIIPIVYRKVEDTPTVEIKRNCYSDIDRLSHNPRLGFLLKNLYKGAVDFRRLRTGDRIAFSYRQKSRLGKPWGQPEILGAVVKTRGKKEFIFVDEEGNAWQDVEKQVRYKQTGRKKESYTVTKTVRERVKGKRFRMPLNRVRITSRFTYKRWHPILHRYRPHLGVDFGARRGTPLHAVDKGRVVYAGWMRGYGKVVKIAHAGGFVSLYAHQSRLLVHRGSYVKRGQVIGRVGSTGRSTGPHLHFGLYHNGRAVDPLKYLGKNGRSTRIRKVTTHRTRMKEYTVIKTKRVPIAGAKALKKRLLAALEASPRAFSWEDYERNFITVDPAMLRRPADQNASDLQSAAVFQAAKSAEN